MAEAIATTYEEWKENRHQSFRVGGINARVRFVSNKLIEELDSQTREYISQIERADEQRTVVATNMRKVLQEIVPAVLISPEWLIQALDDFTDDEIFRLYNIIMHARVKN